MPSLTNAEKRSARFKKSQASFTKEQLAEQVQQNEATATALIVPTTLQERVMAKNWFLEFLNDIHPEVDGEEAYFTRGSNLPDVVLVKEYARYLVRSRVGRVTNKLTVNTVLHYIKMILEVLQRAAGYPTASMLPLRIELSAFIRGDLVKQEGIQRVMHPKPVAHSNDLARIISILYSASYLGTFANMRTVLNVTLYMLLLVDLCGRGAEIAHHHLRPEYMCLRWEDVSFYSFQSDEDDSMDIRAQIKIRWSKGKTLDSSSDRTIPLPGLLHISLALQDTLRILLIVALMDGVFGDSIQTWEQLAMFRVPGDAAETGRIIPMDPDMREKPVLRRMEGRQVCDTPVQTGDMQTEIRRLGRACGFENRFTAYSLRRGVARVLSTQTSVENRMFLMSHKTAASYLPYQSRISTIDFAAMFRNIERRPVGQQTGISLNRSTKAPLRLSRAGQQDVSNNNDVKAARLEVNVLRKSILEKHQSLAAAGRSMDPLWGEYQQVLAVYRSTVVSHTKRLTRLEYGQHFENLAVVLQTAKPHAKGNNEDEDLMAAATVAQEEDIITAWVPIDAHQDDSDLLLTEDSTDDEGEEDGVEIETVQAEFSYGGVFIDEDQPTLTSSPSTALHGLANDLRGSLKNRLVTKRGCSAYNDLIAELESAWQGNEAETSFCLARWYSVCHAIDTFPPGEEPLDGTYNCGFCGDNLSQFHHAYDHTHACAKQDTSDRARKLLDAVSPLNQHCQYQKCGNKATFGTFVVCNQVFDSTVKKGEHMRAHVRSMTKTADDGSKVPTCFFGSCASNPKGGRLSRGGPDFASEDEQVAHVWSNHQVSTFKTPGVTYCEYCRVWLLEPHQWTTHAVYHLEDAQSTVAEVGYCGVQVGRNIVPRICPFCFHDSALPVHERIRTYTREGHLKHITAHLEAAKGSRQHCPCFPAMCTKSELLDSVQRKDHLNEVHGFSLPDRFANGLRRALSDATNEDGTKKTSKKGKFE